MSLYGRRLLGELLSQVQRVAAANPGLASLLTGKAEGEDVESVTQMMAELATAHAHRMAELGLCPAGFIDGAVRPQKPKPTWRVFCLPRST